MRLKKLIVAFVFCLTNISAAGERDVSEMVAPLYHHTADLALLDKNQQKELIESRRRIESLGVYELTNFADSARISLKTHDTKYTEKQKAYKRLLLWYIEERLKVLSASK